MGDVVQFVRTQREYPDPNECYDRASFDRCGRTFTRVEPGEYSDGVVTVFCDQQDSQSWMARRGGVQTGWYWTPERAVEVLLGHE